MAHHRMTTSGGNGKRIVLLSTENKRMSKGKNGYE
jgi:hypothetical protein